MKITTSDRSPRRSRTKSLIGVLTATALLAGATQALAPTSASAMADQDNEAGGVCNLMVQEWLGICYTDTDSGGGTSTGPSSSSNNDSSAGGGDKSSGGGGDGLDHSKPIYELQEPPVGAYNPPIEIPIITSDGERWDATYFPVDSLGFPLHARKSSTKPSSGSSSRRANGKGRGHADGGRRRSSRD